MDKNVSTKWRLISPLILSSWTSSTSSIYELYGYVNGWPARMPILNGFETTRRIRGFEQELKKNQRPKLKRRLSEEINGRLPIFAVSASLREQQREELAEHGVDGWILKPIDFKRLNVILKGVTDPSQRYKDVYQPGCSWEAGGWLKGPPS